MGGIELEKFGRLTKQCDDTEQSWRFTSVLYCTPAYFKFQGPDDVQGMTITGLRQIRPAANAPNASIQDFGV